MEHAAKDGQGMERPSEEHGNRTRQLRKFWMNSEGNTKKESWAQVLSDSQGPVSVWVRGK
jgi:hypothetical protein